MTGLATPRPHDCDEHCRCCAACYRRRGIEVCAQRCDCVLSYDDRQRAAVFTQCPACAHWFYMTVPRPLCPVCTDAAAREAARTP